MEASEVLRAIKKGDLDSHLDEIRDATHDRSKAVGALNCARLRVGDRVRLFGLSPKVLNGCEGSLKSIPRGNSKRFDVELDTEIVLRNRVTKFVPGIPAGCVVKIDV